MGGGWLLKWVEPTNNLSFPFFYYYLLLCVPIICLCLVDTNYLGGDFSRIISCLYLDRKEVNPKKYKMKPLSYKPKGIKLDPQIFMIICFNFKCSLYGLNKISIASEIKYIYDTMILIWSIQMDGYMCMYVYSSLFFIIIVNLPCLVLALNFLWVKCKEPSHFFF